MKILRFENTKSNSYFEALNHTSYLYARYLNILNLVYLTKPSFKKIGIDAKKSLKSKLARFDKILANFDKTFLDSFYNKVKFWLTLGKHLIGRIDWRLFHRHNCTMQNQWRQARHKVEFWRLLVLRIDLHLGFDRNSGYQNQRQFQTDLMQYWNNHIHLTMMTKMDLLGSCLGDGEAIGPMLNPATPTTISKIALKISFLIQKWFIFNKYLCFSFLLTMMRGFVEMTGMWT